MSDNALTENDVVAIIKQLKVMDYCYTLRSTNKFHNDTLLTVFITDKEFKLKIEYCVASLFMQRLNIRPREFVCVVSIHDTDKREQIIIDELF